MIQIQRKEHCCGCSACASICPVGSIEMQVDAEGFKYPHIDMQKCIDCHRCERVCPVINKPAHEKDPEAWLVRTKARDLLRKCTSGGVFTELAKETVDQGGIAYGVTYGDDFTVQHERIIDLNGIEKLPGSKYVQSDMGRSFSQLMKDVKNGKQVIFCGTPCQVAGLKNYLGTDYDNLLLVDLVCHGVPSPKLWKSYVDYLEARHGKLEYVNFRSKRLGYHVSVMEERFTSGKSQIGSARTNLMSKCFFQNVADRPICYECPFKTVSRCSDLTVFDGWHASEYVAGLVDDDKGYSIVLEQSEKGKRFMERGSFERHLIDVEKAITLDGKMAVRSVKRPQSRDVFYKMIDDFGVAGTVDKLFPVSRKDYLIEKAKSVLKSFGVLSIIRKLKVR